MGYLRLLSPERVTAASRIMLPAYVILFGGLGLNYIVTARDRLVQSPTLGYADHLMMLPLWGIMFLGMALLMLAALFVNDRTLYRFALWLGIISMGLWTVVFFLAAAETNASPGGWLWPAFAATACFASNRSLLKGES